MDLPRKKQIIAWCFYDFANSSYSAVIAAVVFPVYFVSFIVGNQVGIGDLWWGRAISLSMLFVVITSPFLGGISDYTGKTRSFLSIYTLICVLAVFLLITVEKGEILKGVIIIVVANSAMEGGFVFYNAYLRKISPKEYFGRISSWGFGIGYLGSIISLLIALILVRKGMYDTIWIMVACFYLIFSLPCLIFMPSDDGEYLNITTAAKKGLSYTIRNLKKMLLDKNTRDFLLAYFFYKDAINTVIVFSSIFASTTLKFTQKELILLYLCIQTTALLGCFLMAKPMDRWGSKKIILLCLLMWICVCISCAFIYKKTHFWPIALLAGAGLGTIQAGSRAFFLNFIPRGLESEYFGVYTMVGKSSAILGPIIFGYISATFMSQRPAVMAVAILFFIGFLLLYRVRDHVSAFAS